MRPIFDDPLRSKAREEASKLAHAEELTKARTTKWKTMKKDMVAQAVEKSRKAIKRAEESAERNKVNAQKVSDWTEKKMKEEKKEREKLASRSRRRSSRDSARPSISSPRATHTGAYSASSKKKGGRRRSAGRPEQPDLEHVQIEEERAAAGGDGGAAQVMVVHQIPNGEELGDSFAGMAVKAFMEEGGIEARDSAGALYEDGPAEHKPDDADNVDSTSMTGPDSRIASGASLRTDGGTHHVQLLPQTPERDNEGSAGRAGRAGSADSKDNREGKGNVQDEHAAAATTTVNTAAAATSTATKDQSDSEKEKEAGDKVIFEIKPPFGMSLAGSAETGVFITTIKIGGNAENATSVSGDRVKVGMRMKSIDGANLDKVGQVQVTYILKNPAKAGSIRAFGLVEDTEGFAAYEFMKSHRLWAIVAIQSWWKYRIKKRRGEAAAADAVGGLEGALNHAHVEGHPNRQIPAEAAVPEPTSVDSGGLADDLNDTTHETQAGHPSYTVDVDVPGVVRKPLSAEAADTVPDPQAADTGLMAKLK